MSATITFFISVVFLIASLQFSPKNKNPEQIFIAPPPLIEYFSFGFQMPLADSLWIRSLQDFDFCEKSLGQHLCTGNGWLSKMLDTITNLAPDYLVAYRAGGLALTVLVSDYPGASKIFDKGVKMFPQDQQLLYRAGYHALIEEKDKAKAAKLFKACADTGGPDWLYSLAAGLYNESGYRDVALKLYDHLARDPDITDSTKKRIREKLGLN